MFHSFHEANCALAQSGSPYRIMSDAGGALAQDSSKSEQRVIGTTVFLCAPVVRYFASRSAALDWAREQVKRLQGGDSC